MSSWVEWDITDVYELVNQGKKRKSGWKWNSATLVPFVQRHEHQQAFHSLKRALTTAPVLGFADLKKRSFWRQLPAIKD